MKPKSVGLAVPKKDLDSVMVGIHYGVSELVRDIALHYCPPPARLLDPMCGNGVFYMDWDPIGAGYNVYFSDIERTEATMWVHSVYDLPLNYQGKADLVIFDPPYPVAMAGNMSRRKDDKRRYTSGQMGRIGLEEMVRKVSPLFRSLISDRGILVMKIQDAHKDGQFIPYHILVTGWLTDFTLFDIIIYRNFYNRSSWRSRYAHNSHSYFLVFRPKLDTELNASETPAR